MGPIPFSDRERDQDGALYVAAIGLLMVFMTYIESSHSLLRGIIAGAVGVVVLLCTAWAVRRML